MRKHLIIPQLLAVITAAALLLPEMALAFAHGAPVYGPAHTAAHWMFYAAMVLVTVALMPLAGVKDKQFVRSALKHFFVVQAVALGLITFCGGIFWEGTSPLWLIMIALVISIITSVRTFSQGARKMDERLEVEGSSPRQ